MVHNQYASGMEFLGEVNPRWYPEGLPPDLAYNIMLNSHDKDGVMSYPILGSRPLERDDIQPSDAEAAIHGLADAARSVDTMVREYRGYDDTQKTSIIAFCLTGHERSGSFVLDGLTKGIQRKILNDALGYRFTPSGRVHFDRNMGDLPDDKSKKDNVIFSHTGNGALIYSGTVHELTPTMPYHGDRIGRVRQRLGFAANQMSLRVQALFLPAAKVPDNTAVLINERVLHRQTTQLYHKSKPPVFARVLVSPLPDWY